MKYRPLSAFKLIVSLSTGWEKERERERERDSFASPSPCRLPSLCFPELSFHSMATRVRQKQDERVMQSGCSSCCTRRAEIASLFFFCCRHRLGDRLPEQESDVTSGFVPKLCVCVWSEPVVCLSGEKDASLSDI